MIAPYDIRLKRNENSKEVKSFYFEDFTFKLE